MPRVLFVEPDSAALVFLERTIAAFAQVDACTTFAEARYLLLHNRYPRLISNLRLGEYHGLHLVYIAPPGTRTVVYTDECENRLAEDVREAGAFYEWRRKLPYALAGYLTHDLPPSDRRDPALPDRRLSFRYGRRCSDIPTAWPAICLQHPRVPGLGR